MPSNLLNSDEKGELADGKSSEPEDILSSSLATLYDYAPIMLSDADAIFIYQSATSTDNGLGSFSLRLKTPDTHSKNWSLHASSIWASAVFLADHIHELELPEISSNNVADIRRLELLELGAGAGLPGLAVAKYLSNRYGESGNWRLTLSDYPDDNITSTLCTNVAENDLNERNCRVLPYAWGEDESVFFSGTGRTAEASNYRERFDVILASDTLWNPSSHFIFISTLTMLLRRDPLARIHLIAGFHTGRYTIQTFINAVSSFSCIRGKLEVARIEEREAVKDDSGKWSDNRKEWNQEGEDYDEKDRRKWVAWIVLRWVNI